MKPFTVSLLQFKVAFAAPEVNFQNAKKHISEAAKMGTDVAVLPEMWNTGYALDKLEQLADNEGLKTKSFLSELSIKYGINIVGGSVATKKKDKFYNTSYVFDRKGNLLSEYDKVHLFRLMKEDQVITAGAGKNNFELDGISAAGVICYDIRFPEWERTLMKSGQQLLFISAQWPKQRIEQWEVLLRARAIENQAFVVAVNCVGHSLTDVFSGHSLVIDPLGNILLRAPENKEGVFNTRLDFSQIEEIRGAIPVFKDRRSELYH
ncbi:carbon-nitrogen family hydrolase [Liquorilactobacillus oeni]|uniref:Amidohydrolase n=1 Tax=Liquorilactobacillus oeni DSM 19972 TaxID=1423777 RepID=A0A0R1MDT7_9LACO|nr:carbon-nitrogen family hydrolase [Liquorilactobacillus oeni]KRL04036.1 amidohydrolase [Liquorilactobacillus oeni DSM 19972]